MRNHSNPIFERGYKEYFDGVDYLDNPHNQDTEIILYQWWEDGFAQADIDSDKMIEICMKS